MKKNLTFSKLLMLVIMAVLPLSMMAQEGKKHSKPTEKYLYIQLDGGLSINHGDLANYNSWIFSDFKHFKSIATEPTWNGHFGIGYQLGKVVGLNLKGGYGLLSGHKHGQALVLNTDADHTLWNLGLSRSNYIEGNLNLTLNLFNMFNYNPRRVINLVPHIGVGGIFYKGGIVNQLAGVDEGEGTVAGELAPATNKRELTYTVPAGMEITFNVAPKFDIFLDYTYTFTGSDKLDQVAKIASDEAKHVINDMDMYSQLNLGLRVKFNNPCDIEKMARESKRITYRVNPDPLVEGEDGNVCFDVIVTVPGEYFEKQAVMNLKPYLAYNGGQIDLDPITFVGEKVKGEGDFRVNYKEGGEFTKHYCMPYQPEMENCELKADPMFYVYQGTIYPTQDEIVKNTYFTQGATEKLADGVIPRPCDPVTGLRAEVTEDAIMVNWNGDAESYDIIITKDGKEIVNKNVKGTSYVYNYDEAGNFNIQIVAKCEGGKTAKPQSTTANVKPAKPEPDFVYFFDYNKYDILGRGRDVINLNKAARALAKEKVQGEIKNIKIEGWASPEGENGINQALSENRSNAAMKDIKNQCKKNAKDVEFNCVGNGPDFETFYDAVLNSTIADRESIVNTVKRAGSQAQKENEVKRLKAIYPELENILKPLRRAEVYIVR